jgi:hypothetical protein
MTIFLYRAINTFIHHVKDNPRFHRIPIGGEADPTYWRYFVLPCNPFFNVYLHNFLKDDEENLHDHRMMNVTIVLQGGGYYEERFIRKPRAGRPLPATRHRFVPEMCPFPRLPSTPHRVVLRRAAGHPIPVWSLFIGLPHVREWGFWCAGEGTARWVPYDRYVASPDPIGPSKVGLGCDAV